jgi:putative nucleotidyltransferase with HDIG domain
MLAVREIATALDAKSSYTIGHSRRVQKLCRKVAEALGLDERQTEALSLAASLHDIGNISIPDDVLRKAGELTIDERSKIEAHVLLGARMVLKAGSDDVVDGIRHHHERWDGGGYPEGLHGEEIPLYARIIGIAEAYDAMTSTRPYRQGLSRQDAIGVLRSEADRQFDHDIVEVFVSTLPEPLAVFRRFPFLAKIQRQFEELGLVFKRMGAVAVSATASTIAIALILGSTVLTPGTGGDAPAMAAPQRRIRPIDRVLASRIDETTAVLTNYHVNDMYGIDVSVGSGATVNDDGETLVAALDGSDVKFGDTIVVPGDDGSGGGNTGGGSGGGTGGGGGGTDIPGPIEGGGGVDRGEGGGTGGGGGGGTTDGGGNTGGGGTTDGGGIDGGTVPPPTTDGDPTHGKDHDKTGNGNSDNAPGHNKDDGTTGSGNGNSDNAPGHNKDDGTTGSGNGNSDNAPGHNKDDTGTGSTDGPPVVTPPPGNGNGNGNGKTDNPPADNGSGNGNGGGPSDGWAHDGSNGNGNPDPSAGGDTPKDNGNSDKSDNGNGNDKKTDPPPSVDPGPSPDSDNGKGNDKKTDVTADETTSTPSPSPSGGNGNGKGPKVEAGTATT